MVSSIRLGGLVSGLDTETIVKDLMKARKAPLNKLFQKKQTEEWRRDQYREMNALLLDLKNKTFDMKMQGTYLKKAVSSDSEAVVSAKQKGTPSLSTYNVEITALSVPAKAASVKFTNSLADGSTAIGEAFDFKIGTTTINVTATDTINSVITKVNAVSSTTGVTASYLQDDKSITFTTTAAGASSAVSIGLVGADFGASNKLNLSVGTVNNTSETFTTESGFQLSSNVIQGTVKINGISYSVNSSAFTFDGVEFNMKSIGTTRVNVKPDENAVFNSIKGFVDKYNEIIDKINVKVSEAKYKDYKPLLDEEKESLSEKQIEQWEKKAKSGLLRQDALLSNALTEMRRALSTKVTAAGIDSNFDTLSEIGITTGVYSEKGKLNINETKLREAISVNGSKVMDLFTKASTSADAATKYNESGLAVRLYDQLNASMSKLTVKAGSSLSFVDNSTIGKDLKRIDTDISKWKTRLQDIEDRYWKQFTAMEMAMSKANSQSGWLANQFGGAR
ncbi:flagellar filament capping protein FliD [Paenibacillus alkaliterrae]|uniref:flagellar filament capping protein FliD n=1 Tax=Paenibacillus alkaliterrae TaxID=320909 RepID=UPI001F308D9C|nr:flagellar filament capping protein FliD [Paenibacillus alkaliterrae]MCF2941401.1 flagellar filament capping protein FliD [Paenibacillus alkaliterrae]